jgi:hypothetical protein
MVQVSSGSPKPGNGGSMLLMFRIHSSAKPTMTGEYTINNSLRKFVELSLNAIFAVDYKSAQSKNEYLPFKK